MNVKPLVLIGLCVVGYQHSYCLAQPATPKNQTGTPPLVYSVEHTGARFAAGLPVPAHVEGKSLVPLLRGGDVALHEAAVTQMTRGRGKNATMGWSLRTSRHRYIEWRPVDLSGDKPVFNPDVGSVELYDYELDPREQKNVAKDSQYASVLQQHQTLFDQLLNHLPKRAQ